MPALDAPPPAGPTLILLALALALAALVLPTRRMHWPLWLRGFWGFALFALASWLLWARVGSPLHARFGGEGFVARLAVAGWWLVAAKGLVGGVRFLLALEEQPREARIVSDLLAAAIYIAASLAIVDLVFAIPVGGLIATSGIIAIVLGLALQSTLADVFSGIAVGIDRPFRPGDAVELEGGVAGRVTQITWRSTHIATSENNVVIVPNSTVAKSRIVNRDLPSPSRGETILIRLDPSVWPERAVAALGAACRLSGMLSPLPAPSVRLQALGGDGAVYEVGFRVATSAALDAARAELLTEIHRQLRFAGIGFAIEGKAELTHMPVPTPETMLAQSDLFGGIDAEQRDQLAKHFSSVTLEAGERLIVQGATPDALYVIAAGALEVTREGSVVHRSGPGESLGAIGLITGEPYGATGTAVTPLKAYRLDKAAITAAIAAEPRLMTGLETLAARGQAALRRDAARTDAANAEPNEAMLARLKTFLRLLRS